LPANGRHTFLRGQGGPETAAPVTSRTGTPHSPPGPARWTRLEARSIACRVPWDRWAHRLAESERPNERASSALQRHASNGPAPGLPFQEMPKTAAFLPAMPGQAPRHSRACRWGADQHAAAYLLPAAALRGWRNQSPMNMQQILAAGLRQLSGQRRIALSTRNWPQLEYHSAANLSLLQQPPPACAQRSYRHPLERIRREIVIFVPFLRENAGSQTGVGSRCKESIRCRSISQAPQRTFHHQRPAAASLLP